MKIRERLTEVNAFLERVYSPEVQIQGAPLEGMSVHCQLLLLGIAMGYETRIEQLTERLASRGSCEHAR